MDLTWLHLEKLLAGVHLHLIRRGDDGSLIMSADRWLIRTASEAAIRFESVAVEGYETVRLDIDLADVTRLTWDRLPRQERRSQVRLHFRNGDIWTFSGYIETSRLESPERVGGA